MANLGIEKMIRRRVGCLELLPKSDGVTPECVEAASNMLDDASIAVVLQSQRPNSDLSQLAVRTTTLTMCMHSVIHMQECAGVSLDPHTYASIWN